MSKESSEQGVKRGSWKGVQARRVNKIENPRRSAKPLYVGSIPTRASNSPVLNNLVPALHSHVVRFSSSPPHLMKERTSVGIALFEQPFDGGFKLGVG